MNNLFNISEEEKNRIRGLHLNESNNKKISSILVEQEDAAIEIVTFNCTPKGCVDPGDGTGSFTDKQKCSTACNEYNKTIKDLTSRGFILGDAPGDEKTQVVTTPSGDEVTYHLSAKATSSSTDVDAAGGVSDSGTSKQQIKDFRTVATEKFNNITQELVGDLMNVYSSKNTRNKQIVDKKGFWGIGKGGLVGQIALTAGKVEMIWDYNKRKRALSKIQGMKFEVVDKRDPKYQTEKTMCSPKQILYYFTKKNDEGEIRFGCDSKKKLYVTAMKNDKDQWNPVMQELYKEVLWFNNQIGLAPSTN